MTRTEIQECMYLLEDAIQVLESEEGDHLAKKSRGGYYYKELSQIRGDIQTANHRLRDLRGQLWS